MDLLFAMRDLGVADPASDPAGEEAARAALAREIDRATAVRPPRRSRRSRLRVRLLVPALAVGAAAAAVVVVVAGGARPAHGVGGGSLAPHTTAPVTGQNTAYVVRRTSARLATAAQGKVMELAEHSGGAAVAGGVADSIWYYTDPTTHVQYSRQVGTSGDTQVYSYSTVARPAGDSLHADVTLIAPVRHAYAVNRYVAPIGPSTDGPSPAHIKRDLMSGRATQDGTATVDGQSTIKLSIATGHRSPIVLYVNSRTYEPVREDDPEGFSWYWLASTAANVASAKPAPIPTGYVRTAFDTLSKQAK